jgi:hypothetical protein
MEWGYIKPSKLPYGSPILFVNKKNEKLGMCINYHTLIKITIKNNHPLPWIHNLFDHLNGASYFTHIYLKLCYFKYVSKMQIWKKQPWGQDTIRMNSWSMSFGLCNTLSIFTTLMNFIFHKKLDKFVIIYIDDILVYFKFAKEHVTHLEFVLQKFKENKLYANQVEVSLQVRKWTFWDMCCLRKGWSSTQRKSNQLGNG